MLIPASIYHILLESCPVSLQKVVRPLCTSAWTSSLPHVTYVTALKTVTIYLDDLSSSVLLTEVHVSIHACGKWQETGMVYLRFWLKLQQVMKESDSMFDHYVYK